MEPIDRQFTAKFFRVRAYMLLCNSALVHAPQPTKKHAEGRLRSDKNHPNNIGSKVTVGNSAHLRAFALRWPGRRLQVEYFRFYWQSNLIFSHRHFMQVRH
jgi:hypothetical protein